MKKITRPSRHEELNIANCPCCDGEIQISDCGYSSFNVGRAKCIGICRREWKFNHIIDQWDVGLRWNDKVKHINKQLQALTLIKIDRKLSSTRDFELEELENEAQNLLDNIRKSIIGGDT